MNDRIQELIDRATIESNAETFDRRYFAELIIRESMRVIEDGTGEASSMAEHCWRQVCCLEIQDHFKIANNSEY